MSELFEWWQDDLGGLDTLAGVFTALSVFPLATFIVGTMHYVASPGRFSFKNVLVSSMVAYFLQLFSFLFVLFLGPNGDQ